MIRHIVMWNFDESFTPEHRREAAVKIKIALEELRYSVDGILSLQVVIDPLPSSNADLMLDSEFESPEALRKYQDHPDHKSAGEFIKSCVSGRRCIDYECSSPI